MEQKLHLLVVAVAVILLNVTQRYLLYYLPSFHYFTITFVNIIAVCG